MWRRLRARVARYNRDTALELERQDREGDYGPAMTDDVEAVDPRLLLLTLPVSFVAYCAAFGFGFSLLADEPPTVGNVLDTGLAFAAAMTLLPAWSWRRSR